MNKKTPRLKSGIGFEILSILWKTFRKMSRNERKEGLSRHESCARTSSSNPLERYSGEGRETNFTECEAVCLDKKGSCIEIEKLCHDLNELFRLVTWV